MIEVQRVCFRAQSAHGSSIISRCYHHRQSSFRADKSLKALWETGELIDKHPSVFCRRHQRQQDSRGARGRVQDGLPLSGRAHEARGGHRRVLRIQGNSFNLSRYFK